MYYAYIVELGTLRKHSNADRLQLCTVFGNTVIVDLSYYEGQKVIFFPVDGQLGESYAEENQLLRIKNEDGTYSGGYLDPDKRNIKAIKLRGEKSDGLTINLSTKLIVACCFSIASGSVVILLFIKYVENFME